MVVEGGKKRKRGRPVSDPFRPFFKHGVAHTYTKNIPAKDWERFEEFVASRGVSKRYAIIRFIQELPQDPFLQSAIGIGK